MTTAPRRGIVLGAGGVLGATWMMAALATLEEKTGIDALESEVVIGTSAGSVLAGFLGSGISASQMANHQRGVVVEGDPRLDYDYDTDSGGALPTRPRRLRVGSPSLLRKAVRHPRTTSPIAALSALVPEGNGSLGPISSLIEQVAPAEWPRQPRTWIVAMDYESGRRTAFGSPGAPDAKLSEAVRASCSIPGWYSPVTIGGRRYVDGGTRSSTSADLLAQLHLDEVYVLAPMSAMSWDKPSQLSWRLERRLRVAIRHQISREVAKLRADGTRVISLAPSATDLAAIGINMMDPKRRESVFDTALKTTAESVEIAIAKADAATSREGLAKAG